MNSKAKQVSVWERIKKQKTLVIDDRPWFGFDFYL